MEKQPTKEDLLKKLEELENELKNTTAEREILEAQKTKKELIEEKGSVEFLSTDSEEKIDTLDDNSETKKLILDGFKEELKNGNSGENQVISIEEKIKKVKKERRNELNALSETYQEILKSNKESYQNDPNKLEEVKENTEKWYRAEWKKIEEKYNLKLGNSGNTIKQADPGKIGEPPLPENLSTEEIIHKALDNEFEENKNPAPEINEKENQTNLSTEIPFQITRDMEQQLFDLGYTRQEVNNLEPQEAWNIINTGKMFQEKSKDEQILFPDFEEAKEIFEKLPEEDKQKIGWGLKTLGFKVEQKKNNFFANVFNKISKKLPEDKTTSRFCKNLEKGFMEDSERAFKTAEKITNKEEQHRIQNTGLLFGNILKYGRMVSDFTGISFASPLRYVMMGGMALSRGAKAATATRLENEDLIEKTRIQDADKAAEEAWNIYELAQKKEGTENVSANALKNAYLTEIPKDLQKRLEEPSTANNLIQNILRKYLELSVNKINSKIEKIESDTSLSQKEKETKIEIILNRQKEKLSDYDGMLTQVGTVDELAMAGRYAQTAGKVIVAAMTVETLYLSYEKISGLLSHILSGSDSSIPMNTGIGKNVIEETLKTKTENQDTLKTIIEQKDSVGTKINDHEIKTEELKNKILEQFKTSETTIHEGEGIEHSFIRQIEHNPKLAIELGFKGDINDAKALHEFAGKEAHIIAIKEGYVDNAGHEVRITEANKVAYEIRAESGHILVDEKSADGKILETHHEGDEFEEKIDKYERVYAQPHHDIEAINDSEQDHLDAQNQANQLDEQIKKQAIADLKSVIEDQHNYSDTHDILHNINQENPKISEYEDISKETTTDHIIQWDGEKYQKIPIKDGKIYIERLEDWVNSPKNTYGITKEQYEKASELSEKIVHNFYANKSSPEELSIMNKVWDGQADMIVGTNQNDLKEVYRPLCKFINKLYEMSGLKPISKNLLQIGETSGQYIDRALFKIASLGKLDEVNFK